MKKLYFLLSVLLFIAIALFLKGKVVHEKFNPKVWKTANLNSEENMTLRWDMMNDLRNNYRLVGMSRKSITNLLGEPETKTKGEFIYYLGYSKTGINTGSLTFFFNSHDIVENINVWQG